MAWRRAAKLADLPPGEMIQFNSQDDVYLVCNAEGNIYALEGLCPHVGGPLAQGALHGNMIVCPWHAWEFDCRTGECDLNPQIQIKRFPVVIDGGEIFADLPENA